MHQCFECGIFIKSVVENNLNKSETSLQCIMCNFNFFLSILISLHCVLLCVKSKVEGGQGGGERKG